MTEAVKAAGGVITCEGGELALVHRPRYSDWTLPKGKLESGESFEDAAVREVEEETGLRCRLVLELPSTSYTDSKGRPKVVRYWQMERIAGEFAPNEEVDELRWLTPEEALAMLTHDRDRAVVRAVERLKD